jgi:hypothetical protein
MAQPAHLFANLPSGFHHTRVNFPFEAQEHLGNVGPPLAAVPRIPPRRAEDHDEVFWRNSTLDFSVYLFLRHWRAAGQ